MKKIIIAMVALLAAAGVSFGVLHNVRQKSQEETRQQQIEAENKVLFSFDDESVSEVSISCDDGNFSMICDDGNWKLKDSNDFLVDQDYLKNLCLFCASMKASDDLGEANDSKKAEYGLDSPDRITFTAGNDNYTVYVGNISPTSNYYYVMTEGRNNIYTVDSLSGSVLKISRMFLKSKDLIPYGDDDIYGITLKKDGKTIFDLKYDESSSTWSLPAKYSELPFDTTQVTMLITTLTRLEAQQMLEENLEDKSVYGLDKPYAEMTITGSDGTSRTLVFTTRRDKTNTYTYVLLKDIDQIELYFASDVDFMDYTPLNFLATDYWLADIYGITGFEFSFGEYENSFELDMTNRKLSVDGKSADIENSDNSLAFQNFFNALSMVTITELDMDAKPDCEEPVLTAVYHNSDGSDKTVQLVDAGDDKCYLFIDGEYTGAKISANELTGKNSVSSFYRMFMDKIE